MRLAAFAAAVSLLATAGVARAGTPDLDACLAASKDGQTFKLRGQLSAARDNLEVCATETCPRIIRDDCMRRIEEIDRAMPTIVVGVHDPVGHDLADVSVKLDNAPLVSRLDGKAVPIDLGPHTLRFEAKGFLVHVESIVAREGEKDRVIDVTLQPIGTKVLSAAPERAPRGSSATPWVLGGIGLVALAAGLGVGSASIAYANGLRDGCGQTAARCQQSDVDLGWAMYVFAGVNDGLAGALLVTSAVLFLVHRSGARSATANVVLGPTPAGFVLAGTF